MLSQVIWYLCVLLEALIVFRGARRSLFSRYPVFYIYLLSVVLVELLRFFTFQWYRNIYGPLYWDTQFLSLVIGCGVVFEIYRAGLKEFPGTARMARNVLFLVFAMVFAKALVTSADATSWWAALTAMKLERDLRIVQASALVALSVVFLVYAIPLSRNLKGMLIGYGIFLGSSVIQLTLMVQMGEVFRGPWDYMRSLAYFLVLAIWAWSLWTLQEAPKPARAITLDDDYNMLVARTRQRFQKTRLALGKVVRP